MNKLVYHQSHHLASFLFLWPARDKNNASCLEYKHRAKNTRGRMDDKWKNILTIVALGTVKHEKTMSDVVAHSAFVQNKFQLVLSCSEKEICLVCTLLL